jgi:hypothetical protein
MDPDVETYLVSLDLALCYLELDDLTEALLDRYPPLLATKQELGLRYLEHPAARRKRLARKAKKRRKQ